MARRRTTPRSESSSGAGAAGERKPFELKGVPASPGVAIGRAFLLDSEEVSIPKQAVPAAAIPREITRFEEALAQTRKEIEGIQAKISKELGLEHAEIFNAHLMFLEDKAFIDEVIGRLKEAQVNVEHVFS